MAETRIIEAPKGKIRKLNLIKVWNYRALMFAFAKRDVFAQYAQTKLGLIWSLIQAISAAFVMNLFFGIFLKIKVDNISYILYAFPGMMAWYYFSYIVNNSGTSLIHSQHIIKKVYFPKLILPLYKTLVGLVDHLIWLIVFFCIMIWYGFLPEWQIFFLPFCIILNIIVGLSLAIWLSALTIRFRDASHIIPFLIGFGVFVTPVFYETTMVPPEYQFLIYFNPMAGIIASYRWCLINIPFDSMYFYGIIPIALLFFSGLFYFRRVEGIMADVI